MALKALNSVAGFSVGEIPNVVIYGNSDVSPANLLVSGKSNLNSISNVIITGGSSGQVIQTDGLGNLTFSTFSTSSVSNGTSNVSIPTLNGNIALSVGGFSNVVVVTTTSLEVDGDVNANGNVSVNNYLVTPATKDLIVAPATQITRFYSNANPFSTNTYDLGNSLARWGNVYGNLGNFTGNIAAGGLLTDNLYYANGVAWDLQQAAGLGTQIQYNDGSNNFAASANFTYDNSTQLLTVLGNAQFNNANLGNLATANYVNVASNLVAGNLISNALTSTRVPYIGVGNNLTDSTNLTWDNPNQVLKIGAGGTEIGGDAGYGYIQTTTGNFSGNINSLNANLGNLATANFVNVSSNLNVTNTANVGNLRTDNLLYANGNPWDLQEAAGSNTQIQYNDGLNNFGASANFTFDYATSNLTVTGNANVTGNIGTTNITATGNISTTGAGGDITMSGGDITGVNDISANSANYTGSVTVNDLTVNLEISGNTANFTGNITALNANLGNLATANYVNVANDLNVIGNITGANLVGPLANGTSNVKVYNNANVEITIGGSANTATFASTGLYVSGEINTTAGNVLSNGNITANSFLNGANANITGQAQLGSVLTANITAPAGVITISAAGTNQNIILAPSGTGNVDVGLHNIIQVADPVNPHDAATKEYVDNIAQGLSIHTPVRVTSTTNLNATYNDGGTALTTTDITGNKTIQFSANHGLSLGDEIYWTNSFNGIVALNSYFVYSIPALNQITVKNGFYGAEVITLTNATGLTEAALGNSGVGATLTNAGANAAISIDSTLLSSTNRVLVQGQSNAWENGVYTVTTVGAPDSPGPGAQWVLTRSSDANTYDPKSTTGLAYGDYFFVQAGTNSAGSSYVLTSPVGEILFGVTNIGYSQFSASGSYTAGSGINISGTIISANTDGVTTDIVGGNIVVKTSANLTTPNIGDASFSSLSWNNLSNGNVTANNLSIGNIANITGNLRVDGVIQANGNISSNANVNGNNAYFTNFVNVGANVTANYLVANLATFTPLIVQNASTYDTRIELGSASGIIGINAAGNTTQFGPSGTITLGGASQIQGGTFGGSGITLGTSQTDIFQNRGGNVTVQVGTGGTIANTWTFAQNGSFTSPGNIVVSNAVGTSGILTDNLYYSNGVAWDLQQAAGSNTQIQYNDGLNNFAASANFTFDYATNKLNVNGNANIATAILLGNTTLQWGNVTTTSTSANQTIASLSTTGVTGVEFLVKGIDSGGKYSVATVQAVTDGTNVDYTSFATVNLGGYTGSLAVNISGGTVRLQVTPASSNSTVWVAQARTI